MAFQSKACNVWCQTPLADGLHIGRTRPHVWSVDRTCAQLATSNRVFKRPPSDAGDHGVKRDELPETTSVESVEAKKDDKRRARLLSLARKSSSRLHTLLQVKPSADLVSPLGHSAHSYVPPRRLSSGWHRACTSARSRESCRAINEEDGGSNELRELTHMVTTLSNDLTTLSQRTDRQFEQLERSIQGIAAALGERPVAGLPAATAALADHSSLTAVDL